MDCRRLYNLLVKKMKIKKYSNKIIFFILIIIISIELILLSQNFILLSGKDQEKKYINEISDWQKGDSLNLHDPFYYETTNFIHDNNLSNTDKVILNAKSQGIRCAYVQAIIGPNQYVRDLIGFDTIDQGMIYFDLPTGFIAEPEIGKNYYEILKGSLDKEIFNDLINDLIVIW